ncbi:MAG: IS1182 family transposase [Planctomycetota bacterium]
MAQFRKSENPDQCLLLPPSPRDWLPQGHLAWFIQDAVAALDIDKLIDAYRVSGKGELPYPPRVMLQILIYAYCTGTFSSRKIAAQIEDSIAFRVLAAGHVPSYRTICRFRETHLDEFNRLFVQVVEIAREAKLVKMGTIAIDGSKVKANASKHKAMTYERMQSEEKRLAEEIAKLTKAAEAQDKIDDDSFGPDFRGDELPKELHRREKRLETITRGKKPLEERKAKEMAAKQDAAADAQPATEAAKAEDAKPEPKDQTNFTDPESRIMRMPSKAFDQSYNTQVAVDDAHQIVVAATVTQSANDQGQLLPVLNATFENTKLAPKKLLADAGYKNGNDFAELEAMKIDSYIAVGREGKNAVPPKNEQPLTAAMREKLKTADGRECYRRRKHIVEPVFGWVKRVLGFRAFSLRGLRKVAGEWSLVCLALNLRRMATMGVQM